MTSIIPPVSIGPAQLLQTNAPVSPAYNPSTVYAADARVVDGAKEYRSLAAGNQGHTPSTSPLYWFEIGTSNELAAFDRSPRSQTIGPPGQALIMRIRPGVRVSALGVVNVNASSMHVYIVDELDGEVLHDETHVMATSRGTYWSWCFEPLQRMRGLTVTGLVPSPTAVIELTFEPLEGTAAVGVVVLGRDEWIGDAKWGWEAGARMRGQGYIDADDNPVRPDLGRSRSLRATLRVPTRDFNRVKELCESYVGQPLLIVLDDKSGNYSSADTWGDFEGISGSAPDRSHTLFTIEHNGYQ